MLLNLLENSCSLKSATLMMRFVQPSLRPLHRQTPVGNGLERLSISCNNTANIRALISCVALQRCGSLEILYFGSGATLADMISGISTNHLPNLSFPMFMEYEPPPRNVWLVGPNGSFLYLGPITIVPSFGEFPLLPLTYIRELRLKCRESWGL